MGDKHRSELSQEFRDLKDYSKEKRSDNLEKTLIILKERGVDFQRLSESHLRVANFDFWPTTGLFIHRVTRVRGRGIFNLLKRLDQK
jgi:hypothetical protein